MSDLTFSVVASRAEPYAAVPTLMLRLRIAETSGQLVHMIALRTQIMIEPISRHYSEAEAPGLSDMFGLRSRWGETLKPFVWTHVATMIPGFDGSVEIDLPVVCTYDMELASTKYFDALVDGEIPLVLQFSGTLFTKGAAGFGVEQLSWTYETKYRLPVQLWREMMDQYFGGTAWLRMSRESVSALHEYKSLGGFLTWDSAITALLKGQDSTPALGATAPVRTFRSFRSAEPV